MRSSRFFRSRVSAPPPSILALVSAHCGGGWSRTKASRQELGTARRAAFDDGLVRIQALAAEAVETLQELLRSKKHPSVQLGAARTILELAVDRHDADTLLKRLEELEDLNKNSFPKR